MKRTFKILAVLLSMILTLQCAMVSSFANTDDIFSVLSNIEMNHGTVVDENGFLVCLINFNDGIDTETMKNDIVEMKKQHVITIETENAVKKFQEIFNLPVTGRVDKSTWYKIKYLYNAVKKISEISDETGNITELSSMITGNTWNMNGFQLTISECIIVNIFK